MHKRTPAPFLLFVTAFLFSAQLLSAQGYEIKVKLENYTKNSLFLAYRLGPKTYIADTATEKDSEGYFVFKGSEARHPGIYLIVTKDDNDFFEFLLPDKKNQQFVLSATAGKELSTNWSVTGSPENSDLKKYELLLRDISARLDKLKGQNKETEEDALLKSKTTYEKAYIKANPGKLLSSIMKTRLEIDIPEAVRKKGNNAPFYYYRQNYWNNINLADNRLLYTALIDEKVENYVEKMIAQNPDSIIRAVDDIIERVKKAGDSEVYQSVLIQLFNKYARSKLICMDKVYLHMANAYYCGKSSPPWIEKNELDEICNRRDAMRNSACGAIAPAISLPAVNEETQITLAEFKSAYTVVFFWMADAKASENAFAELQNVYDRMKNKGVEVLAISTGSITKIKSFINTQSTSWKNVYLAASVSKPILSDYAVTQYPALFLLDKDKKIMYKQFQVNQLEEILNNLIK